MTLIISDCLLLFLEGNDRQ